MTMNAFNLKGVKPMSFKEATKVTISSNRQITIPKDIYDELDIGNEMMMEIVNHKIILTPVTDEYVDFAEEILKELVRDGYEGEELIAKFKERKALTKQSINEIIQETKDQDYETVDQLFSQEKENE